MKTLIYLLVHFYFLMTGVSCSDNASNINQNLLDSLEGTWEEISPCQSCSTITIDRNGTIMLKFNSDPELYRMTFTLEGSSMHIKRHWDVGENKRSNQVLIKFNLDDTLELSQFFVTDASSTTGFDDVVLKKI